MVAVQMSFFLVFLPKLFPSVVIIAIVLICYDLKVRLHGSAWYCSQLCVRNMLTLLMLLVSKD